ncbi:serine/arginine repetitive matrix protein 3-like [Panicum virgatum]|uniref:serine/arginine repetitive matrix protein 3-like n=1 Tax=Panicum virgatum TaxID=38727 RepID=UPI0019D619B8|nr:serine/arginine repetitive matrix protein 3-like [Panicum virgatum]
MARRRCGSSRPGHGASSLHLRLATARSRLRLAAARRGRSAAAVAVSPAARGALHLLGRPRPTAEGAAGRGAPRREPGPGSSRAGAREEEWREKLQGAVLMARPCSPSWPPQAAPARLATPPERIGPRPPPRHGAPHHGRWRRPSRLVVGRRRAAPRVPRSAPRGREPPSRGAGFARCHGGGSGSPWTCAGGGEERGRRARVRPPVSMARNRGGGTSEVMDDVMYELHHDVFYRR